MTPNQIEIVDALNRCTLLPGSSDKRFIRDMARVPSGYQLSDKQENYLGALAWRYRRQMPSKLVPAKPDLTQPTK